MKWLDGITNAVNMNLGKLGVDEGQECLACCSPWGHEESGTNGRLNDKISVCPCWSGDQGLQREQGCDRCYLPSQQVP